MRLGGHRDRTGTVGRAYTVVGVVEFPDDLDPDVVFRRTPLPGFDPNSGWQSSWLVATPTPLTWTGVQKLNQHGIVALSRVVALDPPPTPAGLNYQESSGGISVLNTQVLLAVLIVGLGLLEVVLLAGPAFAVGARRRRRELALVAANGGTPAHLRRIVLADGVVLGLLGAVLGIAVGVLVGVRRPGRCTRAARVRRAGRRVPGLPAALLAIAVLAVLTGVLGRAGAGVHGRPAERDRGAGRAPGHHPVTQALAGPGARDGRRSARWSRWLGAWRVDSAGWSSPAWSSASSAWCCARRRWSG